MRPFWISLIAGFVAFAGVAVVAAPAQAQVSVTRSPNATNPALGRVVRGSTATTFSISTAGAVTKTGNAIRMNGTAAVTGTTVTINCGLLNLACAGRTLRVTIQATGGSGSATLTKFRVGSLSGTNYTTGAAPAEASSLTFDLNGIGLLGSCSFALGMDVLVPVGATTGNGTYTYNITVSAL